MYYSFVVGLERLRGAFFALNLLVSVIGLSACSEGEAIDPDRNSSHSSADTNTNTNTNTDSDSDSGVDEVVEVIGADSNQAPRLEALGNYWDFGGEAIRIDASASDPDGNLLSYHWRQVKGPDIELPVLNTSSLTLRLPEVAEDTQLVFELEVADGQGEVVRGQAVVTVVGGYSRSYISGVVTYERLMHEPLTSKWDANHLRALPSRGVLVELIAGEEVLVQTATDEYGAYRLPKPAASAYPSVQVRVVSQLGVDKHAYTVNVFDNTKYNRESQVFERYVFLSDTINLNEFEDPSDEVFASLESYRAWVSTSFVDFHLEASSRDAAPFAILDTHYTILSKLLSDWDNTAVFPDLSVYWSIKNSDEEGDFTNGDVGGTYYTKDMVVLRGVLEQGADEYDEMLLAHEFGHFFHDNFSRTDSLGGQHFLDDHLNMTVAFSEGFATAFAGMVLEESVYRDGDSQVGFHINLEENEIENAGWYNEISVMSLIYDLYDESNGGSDQVSLGLKGVLDLMRDGLHEQTAQVSIFSFMAALFESNPDVQDKVEDLLLAQEINPYGLDAYGTTEVNDAGVPDLLPVYKPIMPDADEVEVCSIDDFMANEYNYNKLGARQYLRLSVPDLLAPVSYQISVSGDFGRDPEITLYNKGDLVASARNPGGSQEILEVALESGDYIIEIGDYFNLYLPLGKTCFDVSVETVVEVAQEEVKTL